jgi:hypothetical protein
MAARFLATATAVELLRSVFSESSLFERALRLIERIDHVGFMAPAQAARDLGSAARTVGFDWSQQTFPSTILARELAAAAGREQVPTTIFKARGASAGHATPGVEVAMPGEVEPEVVRGWIREGRGEHVAFSVGSPSHFGPLRRLMEEAGFGMPEFMGGAPLTNPFERITTAYFDRRSGPRLRLEFCHYG